jgi:predicted transporter
LLLVGVTIGSGRGLSGFEIEEASHISSIFHLNSSMYVAVVMRVMLGSNSASLYGNIRIAKLR